MMPGRLSGQAEPLAALVHDLRNVLSQVIGYGEMIAESFAGQSPPPSLVELLNVARSRIEWLEHAMDAVGPDSHSEFSREWDECVASLQERFESTVAALGSSDDMDLRFDLQQLGSAVESLARYRARSGGDWPQEGAVPGESSDREVVAEPSLATLDSSGEPSGHAKHLRDARLLVADDSESNRILLARILRRKGAHVTEARDGSEVLERIVDQSFDLIILDIVMPRLDGITALQEMKNRGLLEFQPVVMISAIEEVGDIVKCIESGADDYIQKPFNATILIARIGSLLERKRLRQQERERTENLESALRNLELERNRARDLLLNILPGFIANELQETGQVIPRYFVDTSICFADIVGFGKSSREMPAEGLVAVLHDVFTAFDQITQHFHLEKLKTVGDAYMFAGGLSGDCSSHPVDIVLAAQAMIDCLDSIPNAREIGWKIRLGIHLGPLIGGVTGKLKFAFDVWGETVNTAARLEAASAPNRINISEQMKTRVQDFVKCSHRGKIEIKEGQIDMFFVEGIHPDLNLGEDSDGPLSFSGRYKRYFHRNLPETLGFQDRAFQFPEQQGSGDVPETH